MQQIKKTPKILVLTMFCGEPQYERCIQSVRNQLDVQCTHYLIENKPNVEAHRELYELINKNQSDYDYFVKLDADMEFSSNESLITIIRLFNLETDHLTIPVFDFFINADMPALSVFSNRVSFVTSELDSLFVDNLQIKYPGQRQNEKESQKLVYHCYSPSKEQSIAFGIHRALKVCQSDRLIPDISLSKGHYITLRKVYNEAKASAFNDMRKVAITSAIMVFDKRITGVMKDKKIYFNENFIQIQDKMNAEKWFKNNETKALFSILGIYRFFLGAVMLVFKRISKK